MDDLEHYQALRRLVENTVAEMLKAWEATTAKAAVSERELDTRPFAHLPPINVTINIFGNDMSEGKRINKRRDTQSVKADNSQVAVAGHKAKATATKTQVMQSSFDPKDFEQLGAQLTALRGLAKQQQSGEVAHDKAIAALGDAEEAAKKRDERGVWRHLRTAAKLGGTWLYDLSIKVGGDILREALKASMGLPPIDPTGSSKPPTIDV